MEEERVQHCGPQAPAPNDPTIVAVCARPACCIVTVRDAASLLPPFTRAHVLGLQRRAASARTVVMIGKGPTCRERSAVTDDGINPCFSNIGRDLTTFSYATYFRKLFKKKLFLEKRL